MSVQSVSHPADLSVSEIEHVFATVDIPACPAILADVMKEAQRDVPDVRALSRAMAADIGMSAIAIKLANSTLFRTGAAVASVRGAVDRLGIRNVVCVVAAAALRASMTGLKPAWIDGFWTRTSAIAMAAGMIARRQYGISPDAAYTYALFHDAGIPLLMRRFPDYEQVVAQNRKMGYLTIEAENEYFPCTHPIVGSLLVRNWGLPPSIGRAVLFHHDPAAYDLPEKTLPGISVSLIAVTHVAEHVVSELSREHDLEVGEALYERGLAHLGVAEDDVDQLKEDISAATAEAAT